MTLTDDDVTQLDGLVAGRQLSSVGQIYLLNNPLLQTPLSRDDVKPRLLGHWGTTPGLNFLYAHLNRAIKARSQSTIYITGPGHGGPGLVANAPALDGTYAVPSIHLRRQTSMVVPAVLLSGRHPVPRRADADHPAGGELGHALCAYGAAFDNPDLLVAAVVGGRRNQRAATSWRRTSSASHPRRLWCRSCT